MDIVILIFNILETLQKELYKESSVSILCLVNVENIGWELISSLSVLGRPVRDYHLRIHTTNLVLYYKHHNKKN